MSEQPAPIRWDLVTRDEASAGLARMAAAGIAADTSIRILRRASEQTQQPDDKPE